MKKIIVSATILGLLSIASIAVVSCSKKETTTTKPTTPSLAKGKSAISANVTGAYTRNYKSNDMLSTVVQSTSIINMGSGASSTLGSGGPLTEQFVVLLPANITMGAHKTTDYSSSIASFTYTYSDGTIAHGWTSGGLETAVNFNVTKITAEEVEGTFEGRMGEEENNTIVSVSGSFSAKF